MTRTGKIARLPKPVRDQLNQRLENGEKGTALVRWLNSLPEVQHLIQHEFHGYPIREQNLSEWKKGGYLDWLAQQQRLSTVRQMEEQAEEIAHGTTPTDLNRQLSVILMAELAQVLRDLKQTANASERANAIGQLVTRFAQLRREESSAHRAELACEKWKRHVQKEEDHKDFARQSPVMQSVSLWQQTVRSELDRQAELERGEDEESTANASSPTKSHQIPPPPTKSDQGRNADLSIGPPKTPTDRPDPSTLDPRPFPSPLHL